MLCCRISNVNLQPRTNNTDIEPCRTIDFVAKIYGWQRRILGSRGLSKRSSKKGDCAENLQHLGDENESMTEIWSRHLVSSSFAFGVQGRLLRRMISKKKQVGALRRPVRPCFVISVFSPHPIARGSHESGRRVNLSPTPTIRPNSPPRRHIRWFLGNPAVGVATVYVTLYQPRRLLRGQLFARRDLQ